jgi:hypothetical protein
MLGAVQSLTRRGGDVPGLNSVIKTVTYRSSENDIEVVGLRRGWGLRTLRFFALQRAGDRARQQARAHRAEPFLLVVELRSGQASSCVIILD